MAGYRWFGAAAILGVLAACAIEQAPGPPPAPRAAAPSAPSGASTQPPDPVAAAPRSMPKSRWVAVRWSDLPGWHDDGVIHAWPALLKSCERANAEWANACGSAKALADPNEARVRDWLQRHLQPYRIEAVDGRSEGMITGYYEPLIEASRAPKPGFGVPLHAPPGDLGTRKPWWTRAQIESQPAARAALRGREIAYVADPLDALVLQIQGSGRLLLTEPDGRRHVVRAAFAGHNDHPYRAVARWLVDQGAFTFDQASWPAIKSWARAHPARVGEMLNANPRYVFFREEPLPDPSIGATGAQGVPLTPGRSIAVDRESVPYGTPIWIDAVEPAVNGAPARLLQRLVVAQDTGSAIVGAVRADYFWGWGEAADEYAGRMKHPLRMWALVPRN